MSGYVNRGRKVQMKHVLKLTYSDLSPRSCWGAGSDDFWGWKKPVEKKKNPTLCTMEVEKSRPVNQRQLLLETSHLSLKHDYCQERKYPLFIRHNDVSHHRKKIIPNESNLCHRVFTTCCTKNPPACAVSVLPLVRNWKFTLTAKLVFWRSKQQKTRRFQRFEV